MCTTRKDSESERLAKDSLETNPITIKLEAVSQVAEQSSWLPLPSCSPPRHPLPIKSLASSGCVSPQIINFWVLDKNPFSGPGRGSPSCDKVISHCFDMNFSSINDIEHLFICLLVIYISFLKICSHLFSIFKSDCCWVVGVLCIFWINLLSEIRSVSIISQSVGSLFILLIVSF